MPRRRSPEKRKVLPDPKYKDLVVAKFMNHIMKDGKKSVAEKIVYGAFDSIDQKSKTDPIEIFKKALEEVKKTLLEEIITFQNIDRQKIKKQRSDKYINMGSLSNL